MSTKSSMSDSTVTEDGDVQRAVATTLVMAIAGAVAAVFFLSEWFVISDPVVVAVITAVIVGGMGAVGTLFVFRTS